MHLMRGYGKTGWFTRLLEVFQHKPHQSGRLLQPGPALATVKKVTKFVCCYLSSSRLLKLQQSFVAYRRMIILAMHHVYTNGILWIPYTNSMCAYAPLGSRRGITV